MRKAILLLAINFIVFYSFSQINTFSKTYTEVSGIDGNAIVKTLDNGFIIAGTYRGCEGLIYKIDSTGANLWQKRYNIPSWCGMGFNDIKPTTDSCFVITGRAANPISMSSDLVCMKINTNGNTLWSKAISGSSTQEGYRVQETTDHGFIIVGNVDNNSNPMSSIVLVRLDSNGNLEWRKVIEFGNAYNVGVSVKQLPDSSYIVLASANNLFSINSGYAVLFNISPDGAIVWAKQYYHSTNANYSGMDLLVIPTGIISYTSDSGYMALMKTDFSGNILWGKRYSAQVTYSCIGCGTSKINPVSDGGYILTNGQPQAEPTYYFKIFKLDSVLNIQWSKDLVSDPIEVIEDYDKGLVLLTSPSPFNSIVAPYFGVVKMDSLGNGISCITPSIESRFNDSVLAYVINPITIDSSGTSQNFNPPIAISSWIFQDTGCISHQTAWGLNEAKNNSTITIFPNPFTYQTTIAFDEEQRHTIIRISDLSGKEIAKYNFTGKQLTIEKGEMKAGIYFVQIINDKKNVVYKKLVIQSL